MKRSLALLWGIFAIIFLVLGCFHFRLAFQVAPEFVPPQRPVTGKAEILGMDIDKPIQDFAESYNAFVRAQNRSSYLQNILSAVGYFAAFLTALVSLGVELRPQDSKT